MGGSPLPRGGQDLPLPPLATRVGAGDAELAVARSFPMKRERLMRDGAGRAAEAQACARGDTSCASSGRGEDSSCPIPRRNRAGRHKGAGDLSKE